MLRFSIPLFIWCVFCWVPRSGMAERIVTQGLVNYAYAAGYADGYNRLDLDLKRFSISSEEKTAYRQGWLAGNADKRDGFLPGYPFRPSRKYYYRHPTGGERGYRYQNSNSHSYEYYH